MKKRIIRRESPAGTISDLEVSHPVLRRIYGSRRVQSSADLEVEIKHLLPFHSLLGIERAVSLLATAVMQNKKIMIVGDFDADGATSTAVAIRALRNFGAENVHYLVPNRFAFGYGLTPELVAVATESKPDMIVTVDNGIANHAGVAAAKAAGIQVIITDHHLAAATLPDADAIVNPNQPGDPFPSKNLAGVGVIFYVMLALRRYLQDQNWFRDKLLPEPNMTQYLDLVALGTVADLVPLDRNNRILVLHGLRRIRAAQCSPGIIALLELAKRNHQQVVAADLGFAVGARLNAAGRMDDMALGIECLLCDDAARVREMAKVLDKLNYERRGVEQDMQAQALDVLNKLSEQLQGVLPRGLCLFDVSWHQGVIGILASRIKDKFNRPVVVFAPGQGNELKGSGRSIAGLHLRDVLAYIDATHPGIIVKFGGHAMAAGLTIQRQDFERFASIFAEKVAELVTEDQLQHTVITDGELLEEEMSLDLAVLLRDAGPWGQAFPEPVFDDTFNILEQRIVGDKHLKLRLGKGEKILDAVAFFVNTMEWPNHRCQSIRAAYRLDINEYKGRSSVQLIIDYFEPMN